ncbi:hypothetical protein HETIRDRAFT_428047 [Heterobasidion irregulare TC 32-1]|uniref:DUF6534 domain-containing protein n=1 Tax=Heterobasidion irregulare (strain TC 32-1) TaxID=747525 RepID=W4K150_HETIT|nr:uncharacterized protein HETIRDRAFT_428047 [Heterobasidion irregulare TC 32-1]ETW79542.1 hypothetical protein HETIRDRAFT_428047 [Heterobasidion irregulare TC 32-1]
MSSCVSMPPSDHALVDIQSTYGALFLGVVVSVSFLGIVTVQTWIYWLNYPDDHLRTKATVFIIWILEIIRSTFGIHAVYHYLVLQWENTAALEASIWSVDINLLITALIQVTVHWYFAYRVKILSRGNWILVSVIVLERAGFWKFHYLWFDTRLTFSFPPDNTSIAAETFAKIQGKTFPGMLRANHSSQDFSTAALASAIVTDICIAFSLIYYLNQINHELSGLRAQANHLIFYAINIGVITSAADIVVLSSIKGQGLWYFAIYEIVGGFYANSLLASLNARKSIRDYDPRNDIHMSTLRVAPPPQTELEPNAISFSQMVTKSTASSGKNMPEIFSVA